MERRNASKAQNPWLQLGGYIAEGTQFSLGTLRLRYSRDYEKQADLLGAQIMARAGTTRARPLMRQVEARQFGSTRPQPGSKWRCSGPPISARLHP
jgi:Zn-dependent protease with chaperone function